MTEIVREAKYIDVIPVLDMIDQRLKGKSMSKDLSDAVHDLIMTPKADVRMVIHGTWKIARTSGFKLTFCSNCKRVGVPTSYCPHCGASMRGGFYEDQA